MAETIHATIGDGPRQNFLCGSPRGRATHPKEYVNCAECNAALKALAKRYPERFSFRDMRMTAQERRRAAENFAANIYGGADD